MDQGQDPFLSRFQEPGLNTWFVANFAIQKPSFRTAWRRSALKRGENGALRLTIAPAPRQAAKDFHGSEVQWPEPTHFGRYEVIMTAARGDGIISSFFTYTGPYFGDPHDEIDFEFLGRDTTKVWVNRFAAGRRLPGRWLDLGFDAADGPNLYAFDWLPDRIVWYVNGREFFRITEDEHTIPQTPGKIYINIWGGAEGQRNWSGVAPNNARAFADYHCVSFTPMGGAGPRCGDDWTVADG